MENISYTNVLFIPDCGELPPITNGTASLDDPGTPTFGVTASIKCSAGYEEDKVSIICKENGKWSKATCTIKGKMCVFKVDRSIMRISYIDISDIYLNNMNIYIDLLFIL